MAVKCVNAGDITEGSGGRKKSKCGPALVCARDVSRILGYRQIQSSHLKGSARKGHLPQVGNAHKFTKVKTNKY